MHGKKARKSQGGHLAEARTTKGTRETREPSIAQTSDVIDGTSNPGHLVVKLQLGKNARLAFAKTTVPEKSELDLIGSSRSSAPASRTPSPETIASGAGNSLQKSLSRRSSLHSNFDGQRSANTESNPETNLDSENAPRKRRRLLQGLKNGSSSKNEEVEEIPKAEGSFQTNADLMTISSDTAESHTSEDQPQNSRVNSSTPIIPDGDTLNLPHNAPADPKESVIRDSENLIQTTISNSGIDHLELETVSSGGSAVENVPSREGSEFEKPMTPKPLSRSASVTAISVEAEPDLNDKVMVDSDFEPTSRLTSTVRETHQPGLTQTSDDGVINMDLDDSPTAAGKEHSNLTETASAKGDSHGSFGHVEWISSQVPEQNAAEIHQPSVQTDAGIQTDLPAQLNADSELHSKTDTSGPISPREVLPQRIETPNRSRFPTIYTMAEVGTVRKHELASPMSERSRHPGQLTTLGSSATFTEGTNHNSKQDLLPPRKRASMADDYLLQMVAHTKKSKPESQAPGGEARPNAFTPVNSTPSTTQESLTTPLAYNTNTVTLKANGQPRRKPGRKPKSQNPVDLRLLAPAPANQGQQRIFKIQHFGAIPNDGELMASSSARTDAGGRPDARKHPYAFLNHKRGNSRNGVNSSPSSVGSGGAPVVLTQTQNQSADSTSAVGDRTITVKSTDFSNHQIQEAQTGIVPLPSPADSESFLQPAINTDGIYSQYPDGHNQPRGSHLNGAFSSSAQRRHSTQPNIIHHPAEAKLNHLNKAMPSQLVTKSPKYLGVLPNSQIQAPSQLYSAPMTPSGQFPSPQEGTFGSFQITPQDSYTQSPPFRVNVQPEPAQGSSPGISAENAAIRHFIEQTNLHVFAPQNEGDFEIVRLGAYTGAATFIAKALSTLGDVAIKVAKLRVSFAWMPEGARARSLTMRLDNVEGKELAFKHVCDKLVERFKIVGAGASPATLDVDVILKENKEARRD